MKKNKNGKTTKANKKRLTLCSFKIYINEFAKFRPEIMRYTLYIIILFIIVSCRNEDKRFPFEVEQLVQNKMYGILLEYALYDTTKIDFVNSILCDTLKKNRDLIFTKIETKINDSSYYFFHLHEFEPITNDYIGMIYVDINKFDSIYMYSFDESLKYSTNEFIKVIQEIAKHNNSTVEKTIKHCNINNRFIPNFYFIVMIDSNCYNGDFVSKVKQINQQINSLMSSCSDRVFKNEKVKIEPYIELTSRFTEIYKSRFDYHPFPVVEEDDLLNKLINK